MPTETSIPQQTLPTIYHPKAIRAGLTASIYYSENTGTALSVEFSGLDDAQRPIQLRVPAATFVALAAFCAATLEVTA